MRLSILLTMIILFSCQPKRPEVYRIECLSFNKNFTPEVFVENFYRYAVGGVNLKSSIFDSMFTEVFSESAKIVNETSYRGLRARIVRISDKSQLWISADRRVVKEGKVVFLGREQLLNISSELKKIQACH